MDFLRSLRRDMLSNLWKYLIMLGGKWARWLNEDDKCCTENLTLFWMVATFQTKRQKTNKIWQYKLRCFLFCSSTLCRWRRCYTWNNVHLLNLSQHCDQKVLLYFTLTVSMNLYSDTAAEYINSYNSQGKVLWTVTGHIQWNSSNLD